LLEGWEPKRGQREPTLAQLRALPAILVHKAGAAYEDRFRLDLFSAADPTFDAEEGGLFSTTTASGVRACAYFAHVLKGFAASFKRGDYKKTFAKLFVATLVMERFDFWFEDNDCPGDIDDVMKRLGALWATAFARTDQEIGLAGSNARAHLIKFLNKFGKEVKETDDRTRFHWLF
jgi:hypothetical protein